MPMCGSGSGGTRGTGGSTVEELRSGKSQSCWTFETCSLCSVTGSALTAKSTKTPSHHWKSIAVFFLGVLYAVRGTQ